VSAAGSFGALSDLTIIDLTQMLAGPYGTMMLADQGAQVIKVEPIEGDMTRRAGPYRADDAQKILGGYFQSIDRKENREFVKRFQAAYGKDRVTSDVITAAYNSVLLWAQAVREAGSFEIQTVRRFMRRQSLNAPEGVVSVDPDSQHTWRPVYIAKVGNDGQFDIVWTSQKPVRPIPYPISRSKSEWDLFLNKMYTDWGGWANPRKNAPRPPSS